MYSTFSIDTALFPQMPKYLRAAIVNPVPVRDSNEADYNATTATPTIKEIGSRTLDAGVFLVRPLSFISPLDGHATTSPAYYNTAGYST